MNRGKTQNSFKSKNLQTLGKYSLTFSDDAIKRFIEAKNGNCINLWLEMLQKKTWTKNLEDRYCNTSY